MVANIFLKYLCNVLLANLLVNEVFFLCNSIAYFTSLPKLWKMRQQAELDTAGFILSHLVKHAHVSQLVRVKHKCFVYKQHMHSAKKSKSKNSYRKISNFPMRKSQITINEYGVTFHNCQNILDIYMFWTFTLDRLNEQTFWKIKIEFLQ